MAKYIALGVPVNGAEFLELLAQAKTAGATVPAYVRMACGFEGWPTRGREIAASGRESVVRPVTRALERRSVNVRVTEDEYAELERQAAAAGISSVPQFVRTKCGFTVRQSSLPRTPERDREEDDAVARLERLGLNPDDYIEY